MNPFYVASYDIINYGSFMRETSSKLFFIIIKSSIERRIKVLSQTTIQSLIINYLITEFLKAYLELFTTIQIS